MHHPIPIPHTTTGTPAHPAPVDPTPQHPHAGADMFHFHPRASNPELWRPSLPLIVRLRTTNHKGLIATWAAIHWLIVLYASSGRTSFGMREIAINANVGRNELAGKRGYIQRLVELGLLQIVGYDTVPGLRDPRPIYYVDLLELERLSLESVPDLLRQYNLPPPPRPAPHPHQLSLFDAEYSTSTQGPEPTNGTRGRYAGERGPANGTSEVPPHAALPPNGTAGRARTPDHALSKASLASDHAIHPENGTEATRHPHTAWGAGSDQPRSAHDTVPENGTAGLEPHGTAHGNGTGGIASGMPDLVREPHRWPESRPVMPETGTVIPQAWTTMPETGTALLGNGPVTPENGTDYTLDAPRMPETGTALLGNRPAMPETGTARPESEPVTPETGTADARNRDGEREREKERKKESERESAPSHAHPFDLSTLTATVTEAVVATLMRQGLLTGSPHPETRRDLPSVTQQAAPDHPTSTPANQPPLPATIWALWQGDEAKIRERDRQQLQLLMSTYDLRTDGFGAYWVGRAILLADTCLRDKGRPLTLGYVRSILDRWGHEASWGSDRTRDAVSTARSHTSKGRTVPEDSSPVAPTDASLATVPSVPAHVHPSVLAYTTAFGRAPNGLQIAQLQATVTDQDIWKRVLTEWQINGWQAGAVGKMLDRYRKEAGLAAPAEAEPPPSIHVIYDYPGITSDQRGTWIMRYHRAETPAAKRGVLAQLRREHPQAEAEAEAEAEG